MSDYLFNFSKKGAFSQLARRSPRRARLPSGLLSVPEYSSITRRLNELAEEGPLRAQQMCVEIVRELARMFPQLPIGQHIAIDAQMVPA
jgi:hypothetical protein